MVSGCLSLMHCYHLLCCTNQTYEVQKNHHKQTILHSHYNGQEHMYKVPCQMTSSPFLVHTSFHGQKD